MGGGYGTGREVVEFFSRHGGGEGLVGIATAALLFAVVLGLTFDLARRTSSYEYRSFFQNLIGKFWWAYELLYLLLFLLVLGVLGSAASNILVSRFDVPEQLGLLIMLSVVLGIVSYGREVLEKIFIGWVVLMYGVFVLYFYLMLKHTESGVINGLSWGDITTSAITGGTLYALYNVALAPSLLFAVRAIRSRKEAVLSAFITAFAVMLPAALFHISFSADLATLTNEPVPVYWMIEQYAPAWVLTIFLVVLLGTLAQTGAGLVQGVIERIESVLVNNDEKTSKRRRLGIAVVAMVISYCLAALGIVSLIATGYSLLAMGFAVVYVLPLITIGYFVENRIKL